MDEVLPFLIGLFFGVLVASGVTHILTNKSWEDEASQRGYMTQCVGKMGWHWECDK